MRLGYDQISEILKLIDSSSCEEFVLETGDVKLVLRRRPANGSASPAPFAAAPAGAPPASPSSPAVAPAPAPVLQRRPEATASYEGLDVVRAPMVGIFYRSPSPGAPPFVEVGSRVKAGDALCLVEVMKLFTTIAAERDGTVVEIGAENAALVEYGQVLFVMKPD
jgi:acetyl-CoA carboxylase biotin carboxyl carrier protein